MVAPDSDLSDVETDAASEESGASDDARWADDDLLRTERFRHV